ncbi:MAG: transposase, partial [Planctomycetota bacterium]|nr:transposase [Planctomycetota bacterium]
MLGMELTHTQWELVAPLIPKPKRRPDGRGRPPRDPREVLNGVLWVLRTGARWKDMPDRYPPYQTCHRRFQAWVRAGVFSAVLRALAEDLRQRG